MPSPVLQRMSSRPSGSEHYGGKSLADPLHGVRLPRMFHQGDSRVVWLPGNLREFSKVRKEFSGRCRPESDVVFEARVPTLHRERKGQG